MVYSITIVFTSTLNISAGLLSESTKKDIFPPVSEIIHDLIEKFFYSRKSLAVNKKPPYKYFGGLAVPSSWGSMTLRPHLTMGLPFRDE
jgi:hypothetical protein